MISKYLSCVALTCLLSTAPFISSAASTKAKHSASHHASEASAKALGVLMVINKNEISLAHLAKERSHNKEVKSYADLMIKDHSHNLKKTELLSHKLHIKPIKGPIAQKLQAKGKREMAQLKKLKRNSFDKAYMNSMVKGHTEALALVDKLKNHASNPSVKKHFEVTSAHIDHHLQKANEIDQALQ